MNQQQARWTLGVVILIGGLFGFYTALMIGYFMDALPPTVPALFLIAQLSPYYLAALVILQFCWYVRWQSLSTF